MFSSTVALIILSICLGGAAWLIFIFANSRGRFDDAEEAKYRMLEEDEPLPPKEKE